jgi:hypothetical protein
MSACQIDKQALRDDLERLDRLIMAAGGIEAALLAAAQPGASSGLGNRECECLSTLLDMLREDFQRTSQRLWDVTAPLRRQAA